LTTDIDTNDIDRQLVKAPEYLLLSVDNSSRINVSI